MTTREQVNCYTKEQRVAVRATPASGDWSRIDPRMLTKALQRLKKKFGSPATQERS